MRRPRGRRIFYFYQNKDLLNLVWNKRSAEVSNKNQSDQGK